MMNTSALYAGGGYFYNSVCLPWRGKLEINHGMSQVGNYLEISSGPAFCQKGILCEIKWRPVLIQCMVVLTVRHFFLTLG